MSNPRTGIKSVEFAGRSFHVGDSFSSNLTRFEKEMMTGMTGPVGTMTKPRIPFMEFEVNVTDDDDIAGLEDERGPATVNYRNGQSQVINDAELVGAPDHDASTGKTTIRLEGLTVDWF